MVRECVCAVHVEEKVDISVSNEDGISNQTFYSCETAIEVPVSELQPNINRLANIQHQLRQIRQTFIDITVIIQQHSSLWWRIIFLIVILVVLLSYLFSGALMNNSNVTPNITTEATSTYDVYDRIWNKI